MKNQITKAQRNCFAIYATKKNSPMLATGLTKEQNRILEKIIEGAEIQVDWENDQYVYTLCEDTGDSSTVRRDTFMRLKESGLIKLKWIPSIDVERWGMKPKILSIIESLNDGLYYELSGATIGLQTNNALVFINSIEGGYKVKVFRNDGHGFLFFSEMQNGNRLLWELVCCEILPREFLPLTKTLKL